MDESLFTSEFNCDGLCGAKIEITSHDPDVDVTPEVLKAAGWFVVGRDEAYCPGCVETSGRIQKAQR